MAYPSGPRGRRRFDRGPRKNDRIRAREVRLLSPEGKQIGVVSRDEALRLAKEVQLDLVEISASARPPVCRILDFGKYMYEQSKRQKENKAKAKVSSSTKIKEVKFRVRIEEHDYMTKLRHAEEFLFRGAKVKISLMYRGRENEHKQLGIEVLKRAAKDLNEIAVMDSEPRISGRHASTVLSPLPVAKRKVKFNHSLTREEEDEEDVEE